MPQKGIEERSEQLALIEGLAHDKAVCTEVGDLIAELEGLSDLDSTEKAYVRVARREYDKETKLPSTLVTEMAKQTSLSQAAWVQARKENDFAQFAPYLQKMVDLNLDMASALDPYASPYDVLLDLYEIGSDEKSIGSIFTIMKQDLVRILGKITSRPQVDDTFLRNTVSKESQALISDYMMTALGFDRSRGRLDVTAHPFTTTLGREDIRITTRYMENFFPSGIFSTIHEAGHALYEMDIDPHPDYRGTRLAEATSMGIHESQSRMLENVIGRSISFWKKHYSKLVSLSDKALDGVSLERFVKAINKVEPSLIRVEADEVTYGLHIIARFELESALISSKLRVMDIPEAWNAKMKELLGLDVPDNAHGCLQDIHWSMGAFGYFPSYALGNLYAAQFWATMNEAMPGMADAISKGDLSDTLGWLKKNIHELGASYLPSELIFNITGSSLNPGYFAQYLEEKYSKVYGF
jgi:carboxypeptidase Taq